MNSNIMTKYIKNLQSNGKSAMVLVPMAWMKENDIVVGDQLSIETIGDQLIIRPLNPKVVTPIQAKPILVLEIPVKNAVQSIVETNPMNI